LPETEFEYRNALIEAARLGGMKALQGVGMMKTHISYREACRQYGRTNVDRWIKDGAVTPQKDGENTSTMRLDIVVLQTLSTSTNAKKLYK